MLPFSLPFFARSGRMFARLAASLFLFGASAALRAVDPVAPPIISYNPTITQVQGQLPISTAYPVELMLVVPNGSSVTIPFPVTFAVGSTTRPDTVSESAVAGFVKLYNAPDDLVAITDTQFTGPGVVDPDFPDALVYRKTVHAKVNYPATAVAGTYAFKIYANNPLFVSLGVTNQGSEINGSVTAPVTPPANPPIVSISTPANGTTIEVPGGTTFPQLMDFAFTATVGVNDANPRPITTVSADINGATISLLPTVSKPTPVTGLGSTTVTVNVSMLVTGVGAHIVTARATNDVGLHAQPAVHTFNVVIRKSPLTVTANNQTRTYGSANPTLTYTITGFINGETLETSGVTGTPNVTTTATAFSPVLSSGSYAITPSLGSLASSKYDFVFVDGSLTVEKAVLTVQPEAVLNLPFGLPIPTLSASIDGVLAGDPNTPAYTGSPSLSTNASILSLPGLYTITSAVGSLSSNNYRFDFKTAGLTIGKRTITITAQPDTKVYGSANPAFGFTTSGVVAGDTTPFTGVPSLTSDATASSTVAGAPYTIVAALGSLASSKYDFEFVNSTLTVTRAPLVVTAASKTKTQGDANPPLTYTITGFVLGQTETTPGVLTSPVSISTTAVTSSPAGTYPITVSGAAAPNYSITYNNATLTVTSGGGSPVCMTMEFEGSTAASGTAGNIRTYTMNGVTVKVSAYSRVRPSPGGALVPAYLGVFPGGLGVTDTSEGNGSGNLHTVDNIGRDNFVLFEFSQPVKVNRAFLGYVINDSDLTAWIGNASGPVALSDSILNGMSREDNDTTSGNARWADINAGQLAGNVLVIAGSLSDTSPDDEFKIGALDFCTTGSTPPPVRPVLVVTAEPKSKTYGADNPALTATITGFLSGDTLANSVTGSVALSTNAAKFSAVGDYTITAAAGSLASTKYDFQFVGGALAITPRTLTLTADNKTKTQGAANPVLTYTASGFVNNETTAIFSKAPTLTTSATAGSPAGSYVITIGAGSPAMVAPNYTLQFVSGTLTVTTVTTPQIGTASGSVFFDVNLNGGRNTDEPSLAGITVKLYKKNGWSSQYISQTTTNASGIYSFQVTAGTVYEVDVVEVAGMTATTADERVFTANTGNAIVPDVGLGLYFCALANLCGDGKSHGYWKSNIGKANDNKTSGVQETKAELQAYTNTISGLMLTPFAGLTLTSAESILEGNDQLKLQLLASEYNFASGRLINDSMPLTYAFIYWGEYVSKNASNYSNSYRKFVKDWMDAFNNSYGGRVDGPIP